MGKSEGGKREGDSPILLRKLRKIGTVPGRFEIVSWSKAGPQSRNADLADLQLENAFGYLNLDLGSDHLAD